MILPEPDPLAFRGGGRQGPLRDESSPLDRRRVTSLSTDAGTGGRMPQCNVCMADIDETEDTHIEVVKPMEWKGDTREIRHYYCSVSCLLEQVRD